MPDLLEAVGDPGLRSALLFVRGQDHPITADELAAHEGVHRNVARSRLERLCAAGLVAFNFGHSRSGAGRPAKTYRAAPHLDPIEFPARHYETLIGLLGKSLSAGEQDSSGVGAAFGRELAREAGLRPARSAKTGIRNACSAVRSLGYQATMERSDARETVIVTPTCPLRSLVAARPELAAIDRGMWAGLAAAAVAGSDAATISCSTEGCLSPHASCRVRIRFGGDS